MNKHLCCCFRNSNKLESMSKDIQMSSGTWLFVKEHISYNSKAEYKSDKWLFISKNNINGNNNHAKLYI